jgi:hypothetical protein
MMRLRAGCSDIEKRNRISSMFEHLTHAVALNK